MSSVIFEKDKFTKEQSDRFVSNIITVYQLLYGQ